jgi:sulfur carrier protein ThiS
MITVTVHLHTILQRQTPDGLVSRLVVEIPLGSTLADVLQYLTIDLEPEHLLLVINGRVADLNRELQNGDQVNLMPAISGGSYEPLPYLPREE